MSYQPHFRAFAALIVLAGASAAHALPSLYTAGSVRQALRLPDGSMVITGYFTAVGEIPRAGIAKLSAAGQLDPNWTAPGLPAGFASQAVALAASPDGSAVYIATGAQVTKVSAGGTGATVAGFSITASGSVDGGNSGIRTLAVDASGIYVAGAFAYIDGQPRNAIARLSSAGVLDGGWIASTNSTVNSLAIDDLGGFVYLGGAFVNVNSTTHLRVARLHALDASIDATWSPTVTSALGGVAKIALSPAADTLVVAGNFTAVNSTARSGVARLICSTAALDAAWNPAVAGYAVQAIQTADDFVYFGGDSGCCGTDRLLRVSAAGTGGIDPAWVPALDAQVRALLPGASGPVLAFGDFAFAGNVPVLGAAAIAGTGSASHMLPDVEVEGSAAAMATEASGTLLVAGNFQKVDDSYRGGLFRLKTDQTPDTDFVPPRFEGGSNAYSRLLAVESDPSTGAVYVGGSFDKIGGVAQDLVVRLDGVSGAIDPAWTSVHTSGPSVAQVQTLAVDSGYVYIGGSFSQVNATPRSNLARLTTAGALDPSWTTATNGAVSRMVLSTDALYIAGTFLVPGIRLARLLRSDGSVDSAWHPPFNWATTWDSVVDMKPVGAGVLISDHASVPEGGGVVSVGDLVLIDSHGAATEVARFNQNVDSLLVEADSGSVYLAGTFQEQYALDDFFAQTSHPLGLAHLSLRPGTLGVAETWTPAVQLASNVPGLARLGAGPVGILGGSDGDYLAVPRAGLDALDLPPGQFLFKDGFGP